MDVADVRVQVELEVEQSLSRDRVNYLNSSYHSRGSSIICRRTLSDESARHPIN